MCRTPNPEPRTPNPEPRTPNPEQTMISLYAERRSRTEPSEASSSFVRPRPCLAAAASPRQRAISPLLIALLC